MALLPPDLQAPSAACLEEDGAAARAPTGRGLAASGAGRASELARGQLDPW